MRYLTILALSLLACGSSDPAGGGGGGGGGGGNGDPCGEATGSAFQLIVWDAVVNERKPDGRAWDIDGSYADVYACIGSDTSDWAMRCTDTYQDRTTVDFGGALSEGIANADVFIDLWDEDLTDSDPIGTLVFDRAVLQSFADCGEETTAGNTGQGYSELTFEVRSL